jgi:hypothetical protein
MKIICELQTRSFEVVATVCDQGSTNVSANKKLQKRNYHRWERRALFFH